MVDGSGVASHGARAPLEFANAHKFCRSTTPDGFHFWITLSPRTSELPGAKFWRRHWSAAIWIASTVEICIQQLGRVEEIVWLPYDAGLSAAAETLVGILKRVTITPAVYLRFLEFLHGHSDHWAHTVTTLVTTAEWRHVWNRVRTTAQHSELFRRRHSTRQSHGLFALAKHL